MSIDLYSEAIKMIQNDVSITDSVRNKAIEMLINSSGVKQIVIDMNISSFLETKNPSVKVDFGTLFSIDSLYMITLENDGKIISSMPSKLDNSVVEYNDFVKPEKVRKVLSLKKGSTLKVTVYKGIKEIGSKEYKL